MFQHSTQWNFIIQLWYNLILLLFSFIWFVLLYPLFKYYDVFANWYLKEEKNCLCGLRIIVHRSAFSSIRYECSDINWSWKSCCLQGIFHAPFRAECNGNALAICRIQRDFQIDHIVQLVYNVKCHFINIRVKVVQQCGGGAPLISVLWCPCHLPNSTRFSDSNS